MSNPCLSCGACCAFFRASFHWLETTSAPDGVTRLLVLADVITEFDHVQIEINDLFAYIHVSSVSRFAGDVFQ